MTTAEEALPRSRRAVARAEHVGSLLRPAKLRELFAEVYAGTLTPGAALLDDRQRELLKDLNALADEAIAAALQRQVDIGLDVVTDGEMRRPMFTHSVVDALAGYEDNPHEIGYRNEDNDLQAPPTDPLIGAERLRKVANPAVDEVRYLRTLTDHDFKVTFPSGSYWYYEPARIQKGVYETQEELVHHVVGLQREIAGEVIDAGARHVQFDWPLYPALVDTDRAAAHADSYGYTLDTLLDKALEADRMILDEIPPGVTKALHICRGNYRSRWLMKGSLEPLAERLFELPYDRFLIEWDDPERAGDFSALRHVPRGGPIVVMGVVSTKSGRVETADELERRIDEASQYLPVDQLAISPQCGFASTWEGNEITEEIQWRKLEAVAEVADRVWPS